jgi:acetoin utilization deacetylase AcuC-like enzyme
MSATALIYHPDFSKHRVGQEHPERPQRITEVMQRIKASTFASDIQWIQAEEADDDPILLNHTTQHVDWVSNLTSLAQISPVSADTHACPETPRIVRFGVGSVIKAIDMVMAGKAKNAFCAVRPPGHHAESDRAMGFCFFNNVAIGAHYLRQQYALERVAIIDWDVHHGNGTQNSFYRDEHVFFCSIHQAPHYPGTGAASETGQGKGLGSTLNIPVPYGSEDSSYFDIFKRRVGPALRTYNPDFILLSAGFDAHWRDPLGDIRLTTEGFRTLSKMVAEWAGLQSQGRLVSVLEGGYDLEGLCESTQVHLEALIEA